MNIGCTPKQEPISKTAFLMDTAVTLKIYDKQDEKIIDKAIQRLKEIENRMSRTIEDSDISLINKNSGIKPVQVHDDVYYVLEQAKYFSTISNGAFDPTIGPLVDLWDITGDKGERDSLPTDGEIKERLELVNYNDLELMEDNYVYLKRQGMELDLGGIVKGYAADEVKRIFLENGVKSAIIDLGGNIYALGEKSNGDPWRIGIQNPFDVTGTYIGIISLKDKSVVTSGNYERFFIYQGKRYHHILDTKTGYPSESGIAGVSVITDKSIYGDALSTALFVLGVEEGTKLINTLEDVDAIFITDKDEVVVQDKLLDKFELRNDELKLVVNPN